MQPLQEMPPESESGNANALAPSFLPESHQGLLLARTAENPGGKGA